VTNAQRLILTLLAVLMFASPLVVLTDDGPPPWSSPARQRLVALALFVGYAALLAIVSQAWMDYRQRDLWIGAFIAAVSCGVVWGGVVWLAGGGPLAMLVITGVAWPGVRLLTHDARDEKLEDAARRWAQQHREERWR
jgi:hypothetical protein